MACCSLSKAAPSSMPPPSFSMESRTRWCTSSSVCERPATPTTRGTSSPRFAIAYSAGKIFLVARSPVNPNSTRASERGAERVEVSSVMGGSGFLLRVPAELGAHGGQDLVGERGLATRGETVVQRGAEHLGGNAFVDGGLDRPAAFAGIGHAAAELRQLRVGHQGLGGEIEQPRAHHAAAAPHLGHLRDVD